ncbi:MAG: RagB/SusD family nutrient uptake outer membrane protein, partial [Bacteroidales bacterium]|nr:RagB/SusD family nutrient uptake outer membrane protein [Bacteroidales bacterium]
LDYFERILKITDINEDNSRYKLTSKYKEGNWKNLFTDVDIDAHIYTIWFNGASQQTNELQKIFSPFGQNLHLLKPTRIAVENWETIWNDMEIDNDVVTDPGTPGDFYRGHGVSYIYYTGTSVMTKAEVSEVLLEKSKYNFFKVDQLMKNADTAVYKYSISQSPLDFDANYTIYRAADIHLFVAEIYARLNITNMSRLNSGQAILNTGGEYFNDVTQLGVRGRVGFGENDDAVAVLGSKYYLHNPYTNEIDSVINIQNENLLKRLILTDKIIEERAREFAFEGKRFYDLMRIAKRRNDPSYLADKVSAKYTGAKKDQIRALLMDEKNWYIQYFE